MHGGAGLPDGGGGKRDAMVGARSVWFAAPALGRSAHDRRPAIGGRTGARRDIVLRHQRGNGAPGLPRRTRPGHGRGRDHRRARRRHVPLSVPVRLQLRRRRRRESMGASTSGRPCSPSTLTRATSSSTPPTSSSPGRRCRARRRCSRSSRRRCRSRWTRDRCYGERVVVFGLGSGRRAHRAPPVSHGPEHDVLGVDPRAWRAGLLQDLGVEAVAPERPSGGADDPRPPARRSRWSSRRPGTPTRCGPGWACSPTRGRRSSPRGTERRTCRSRWVSTSTGAA